MASQTLKNKSETALRTIGEAAVILKIPAHVIRFWETKFTHIKPTKFNGRRYYSPQNIDDLKNIQHLLYEQKFTIEEAADKLSSKKISKKNTIAKLPEKLQVSISTEESNLNSLNEEDNRQINLFEEGKNSKEKPDFIILVETRERLYKAREMLTALL